MLTPLRLYHWVEAGPLSWKGRVRCAVACSFPYKEFRRGQREVAEAVSRAVREGAVFALQAPTGFGKTAAVIYGLRLASASPVLYVVRTRNEIAPPARELHRFGARYVFLYSARRMCPLLAGVGGGPSVEEFWENCRLMRLRGQCRYYEEAVGVDSGRVLRVVSESGGDPFAVVERLRSSGVCPFFALRKCVDEVDFIVATYPYLFTRKIFLSVFEPHDYNDYYVVVDEAHSLMDIHTLLSCRLTVGELEAALREMEEHGAPGEMLESVRELARYLAGLKPTDRLRRADKERGKRILGDPQKWADLADEIRLEKFKKALEIRGEGASVKVYTARIAMFAETVWQEGVGLYYHGQRREGKLVVYLEAVAQEPGLVASEPLNTCKAAVLMSGTMPPESYIRDVMGVTRRIIVYDVELLHGNVLPGSKRYTVVAADVTSRYTMRGREMYRRYARYVEELYHAVEGWAVMVVYPSYDFMRRVLAELGGGIDMVTESRDTSISDVARRVLERRHVLINAVAGGKLTEGVEITDERGASLLRAVMVAGVPYPQPDDLLEDFLERLSKRIGEGRAKYYAFTVTAVVKAKQALGRAIRRPGDRAVYVLADRRFFKQDIRSLMRIKYNRVVHSPEELREAIRSAGI